MPDQYTYETMTDREILDALVSHTLTELKDDKVKRLTDYAIRNNEAITIVDLPNVTSSGRGVFLSCKGLKTTNLQNTTGLNDNTFGGCGKLENISVPLARSVGEWVFYGCKSAGVVELPAVTSLSWKALSSGYGPSGFDLSKRVTFGNQILDTCYNLAHLVLRSDQVCPMTYSTNLVNSLIANGYGYIYVPSDLVDEYKSATNWSTYADRIVSLDLYPLPINIGTITDSWAEIFAAEQDGTYQTKYSIGDTKSVDIDGQQTLMEIVAMDTDVLASDSTKTAKITWMSVGALELHQFYQAHDPSYHWGNSEMRRYLREELYPTIEDDVRSHIVEVSKTYRTMAGQTNSVNDTLWVPSSRELNSSTYAETSGVVYSDRFPSQASRVKNGGYYGSEANSVYYLRSLYTFYSNYMYGVFVSNNGAVIYSTSITTTTRTVLGFCT